MDDDSPQFSLTPVEQFGVDVKALRTARRMSVRGLGSAVGCSGAYVSKVENAKLVPSEQFAEGCDRTFGTGTLLARQRQQAIEGDHPAWFEPYTQRERKARQILNYSTVFVPGLFQTPEYARALYRASAPRLAAAAIESRLSARMRRHEVLERANPPEVWVVLYEACVRTLVGSCRVMARQLERLTLEASAPNVTVQFIPFDVVPAMGTAFTLLVFDQGPTVLHVEGPQGGRPLETPKIVKTGLAIFDRLRAEALGHDASVARIQEIHKEYAR
ncbi:helix-turn-helix domain-containing protein [Streptomyces jumonjinensis]|uniref:Helix-turn-helix domain-containing protein n=1 Tax=Streptomyces jumonjinensis TaxID=1945 RepID=A0A646KKJ3_STRJU|nr:helix-turn-helix transcriptional regulator [Streptomyces jumonjinensis]MQT02568.1 helix-turn-helix domain-containing protein [Streptomyces jumonjinensis]